MTVPAWVQDAVFYQIFPDRFANGDPSNDPENVQSWGSVPTVRGFMGGDLRGIIQNIDYLLDLGITALYLNPIFEATSNHRYNASDYLMIDRKLGTLADFKALIETAHRNGIRVILDGVFNHCGRGFFAFQDVLENGEDSPYHNWFHVKRYPVDAFTPGDAKDYLGWWKLKSLPKFNTDHKPVRQYLLQVTRYWLEQGMDGWRLDVPNEIDDLDFWAEFRQVVNNTNSEAYILGEIWDGNPLWVGEKTFDGLMNYPVRTAILGYINGTLSAEQFAVELTRLEKLYDRPNWFAMYNLVGSHDTERILTMAGGDIQRAKLAFALLFSLPGAPSVYYGDEIGLTGGKDPDCRKAFPWKKKEWNTELRSWVQNLIAYRKHYPVLRRGDLRFLDVQDGKKTLTFARLLGNDLAIFVSHAGNQPKEVSIPLQGLTGVLPIAFTELTSGETYPVDSETLTLRIPGGCCGLLVPTTR